MSDWAARRIDPNPLIVRVLVEASHASPLKVPRPEAIDDTFWVRQRGWRGLIFNEALRGRFVIPDDLLVFTTPDPDVVPVDRVVLVKPGAAFLVCQGDLRGVVSNRASDLLQIQLFST